MMLYRVYQLPYHYWDSWSIPGVCRADTHRAAPAWLRKNVAFNALIPRLVFIMNLADIHSHGLVVNDVTIGLRHISAPSLAPKYGIIQLWPKNEYAAQGHLTFMGLSRTPLTGATKAYHGNRCHLPRDVSLKCRHFSITTKVLLSVKQLALAYGFHL